MNFRTLVLAALAANLALIIPASAQVYNGAGEGATAQPVFIPKQGASTDQVYNANPGDGNVPSTGTKYPTQDDYKRMKDKVERDNKRQRDAVEADVQAKFAANAQRDAQWAAEKAQQLAQAQQASGGGSAAAGGKSGTPADPNEGKTRVFINAPKETPDKPVRLFNVK